MAEIFTIIGFVFAFFAFCGFAYVSILYRDHIKEIKKFQDDLDKSLNTREELVKYRYFM